MAAKKKKKKLTPAQQRRKRIRQENATIYNPGTILTGNSLRAALADLVNGETQPGIREANRQITTGRAQGRVLQDRSAGIFKGLDTQQAAGQLAQTDIANRTNATLKGIDEGAAGKVAAAGAQAAQAAGVDVAARGEGLGGGGAEAVQRELAAQAARQAQAGQTFRSFGALQGGAQEGYAGALRGASQARGGEVQATIMGNTQKNERELLAKRKEIADQKGPLRTKLLLQLRQAGFDQLATQMGLKLKSEDLAAQSQQATDALNFKISDREDDQQFQAAQNDADRAQSDINNQRSSSNSGSAGGLTPTQQRAAKKDYEKAVGQMRGARYGFVAAKGNTPGKKGVSMETLLGKNPKKWRAYAIRSLQGKYGHDIAKKAVDRIIATETAKQKRKKKLTKKAF